MKYLYFSKTLMAFIMVLFISWSTVVYGQEGAVESSPTDTTEQVFEATESVESDVVSDTVQEMAERRSRIISEAVDALAETKTALTALDEKRIDDALDALAVVTGKLEILVAREPSLALAPTDVTYSSHDLYADTDSIEIAIEEASAALNEGKVQVARTILKALGSEMVISVSHLPLATYPDAIADIVPLIDRGEIEEAKSALQTALNTQVVREYIFPLPVLRAGHYLDLAEELTEKEDRTDDESALLENHLSVARNQLEMAELLGYGNQELYPEMYAQLDEIDSKTSDGKSGAGFFDLIRKSISDVGEEES